MKYRLSYTDRWSIHDEATKALMIAKELSQLVGNTADRVSCVYSVIAPISADSPDEGVIFTDVLASSPKINHRTKTDIEIPILWFEDMEGKSDQELIARIENGIRWGASIIEFMKGDAE